MIGKKCTLLLWSIWVVAPLFSQSEFSWTEQNIGIFLPVPVASIVSGSGYCLIQLDQGSIELRQAPNPADQKLPSLCKKQKIATTEFEGKFGKFKKGQNGWFASLQMKENGFRFTIQILNTEWNDQRILELLRSIYMIE